jgi:hypothetical protein
MLLQRSIVIASVSEAISARSVRAAYHVYRRYRSSEIATAAFRRPRNDTEHMAELGGAAYFRASPAIGLERAP